MWNTDNPFARIKGRYLAVMWILPLFYLPGADSFLRAVGGEWRWYWWDIVYYYYGHVLFIATVVILAAYGKLSWSSLLGNSASAEELVPALKLTLFIFLFSIAAAYLLFWPLSFVMPEFVEWWYISPAEVIYYDDGAYPVLANALGFASLVIIAPVIEEVAFRGMLLHRWTQKWGLMKAILISSLLFGIVHPDPIGAIAFGIAMCALYLRTQSLFIPVICHAANNLWVWLWELGYRIAEGPEYAYTLEDFRSEWYVGLVCGILTGAWAYAFYRKPGNLREWRLPVV